VFVALVACGVPGRALDPGAVRERAAEGTESRSVGPRRQVRFIVMGDYGDGSRGQRIIAERMCRWRRRHPLGLVATTGDLVATTGDNVYPDGHPEYFEPISVDLTSAFSATA
jgi:hypothetical protein